MIEVEGLTKTYGEKVAVQDLSFVARTGRVTGLLGPNGAGKSTTMRMILGLHRATSGSALVDGRAFVDSPAPMTAVGAMLDAHAVHPGRTARNYLDALAATHHLPARRVDEVLELTGMTEPSRRRVGTFSLGMVQRLGIAAALLGSPHTLVLDEPVNGLDPDGVHWVRELVRSLAAAGTTVLLSSHLMSEMAQTADDVVVLGRGRLVAAGAIADVVAAATASSVRVRLATESPAEPLTAAVTAAGGTTSATGDALVVTGLDSEQIGHLAARTGSVLAELTPQSASLEDAFFELTKDSIEYTTGGTTS
ncbi:ABC transporter ATP-binding protein [Cellulomonas xylanilytica]|uniref:Putative ABC transporter, ATP-binding protein n=1 Tax=Cellulomonas xylanilytica TaxID=233583 RepID=A0A510V6I4_9CELL|nr:ATP-binding cassette domain-containing protein [Cellulomonas xylanilytica]GEK21531.1 putative ABC transporter, ATP-binding protein [Cellulomonas xylanilytica]